MRRLGRLHSSAFGRNQVCTHAETLRRREPQDSNTLSPSASLCANVFPSRTAASRACEMREAADVSNEADNLVNPV